MKTGVQKLCNELKKLDSGFHRNDKKWCFSTFYEFIKFGFPRHSYCHRSSFAFGPKYVCLTVMRLILELLRFDSCTIFRMILLKKLETMSSLRAVVSVGRRLVQDSLPMLCFQNHISEVLSTYFARLNRAIFDGKVVFQRQSL